MPAAPRMSSCRHRIITGVMMSGWWMITACSTEPRPGIAGTWLIYPGAAVACVPAVPAPFAQFFVHLDSSEVRSGVISAQSYWYRDSTAAAQAIAGSAGKVFGSVSANQVVSLTLSTFADTSTSSAFLFGPASGAGIAETLKVTASSCKYPVTTLRWR